MKIKTFVLNKNNKIEITEKELKQLLDEMYWEGYRDGKGYNWTYVTPSWTTPYITCTDHITTTPNKYTITANTDNKTTISM